MRVEEIKSKIQKFGINELIDIKKEVDRLYGIEKKNDPDSIEGITIFSV